MELQIKEGFPSTRQLFRKMRKTTNTDPIPINIDNTIGQVTDIINLKSFIFHSVRVCALPSLLARRKARP